jgi:hypothetical protein
MGVKLFFRWTLRTPELARFLDIAESAAHSQNRRRPDQVLAAAPDQTGQQTATTPSPASA